MKKNVLIFNQSSELYGSDKALLELLENYPEGYHPVVVLENEGPLKDILLARGIQVIKAPVMKLTRKRMSPIGMVGLIADMISGLFTLWRATRKLDIRLVHSNSIAVLMGGFYALIFRKKHVWHVHEIVEHPKVVANLYPKWVNFFSHYIVFNSGAAMKRFLEVVPSIKRKSAVVYNGQTRTEKALTADERMLFRQQKFNCSDTNIVIGLVGRISRWKGQLLLLDAFKRLIEKYPDTRLVYLGSPPPGQEYFVENLQAKITEYHLSELVTLIGFDRNIWPYYDAMDIVAVPSTDPEPFGLVATEAMLSSKPVVGSGFGGLAEVIVHNQTGLLVTPNSVDDLTASLELLIADADLRHQMGMAGHDRVAKVFSTKQYVNGIAQAYAAVG